MIFNSILKIIVKPYFLTYLFLLMGMAMPQGKGQDMSFTPQIAEPYPPVTGRFSGKDIPASPDPLVGYQWKKTTADDELETYILSPQSISSDKPDNIQLGKGKKWPVMVHGPCNLMFDFGKESAGWLEFDSDDFDGKIEMSISEYNQPAIVNTGAQHPKKTLTPVKYGFTYRLELNRELYEGVRFGWIHIKSLSKPFTIKDVRLVCQVKPANYQGSFSCSDTTLTRIWYTGAYTVKLNFQKDYFGAILMERSDRFSWTGDAFPAQAASMVAFGNYDFVRKNLLHTSTQSNNIASYPLYWVLSLVDYSNYTGDKATLNELLENACAKLDEAYNRFDSATRLGFNGWDERLGAGFENSDCLESQYVYRTLSIEAWKKFSRLMAWLGRRDLSEKYGHFVDEKMAQLRQTPDWPDILGIHASSNLVNAGMLHPAEETKIWRHAYSDRQHRLSYSPFNQFFIIQALAKMGKLTAAFTTLDDCWGGQLRYGATSFFEVYRPSWNEGIGRHGAPVNNQCGYTSLCHPWSAGVTKWISEQMLGIQPTTPGFATFDVKPNFISGIDWVKGSVPTLHGIIELSYDAINGKMELTVPDKTIARVGIPKERGKITKVFVNGKNTPIAAEDDHFIYIEGLAAGQYQIKFNAGNKTGAAPAEPFTYRYQPATVDLVTQGDWNGKYGSKGYVFCNYDSINGNREKLPDFIEHIDFRLNGGQHFLNTEDDPRALEADQQEVVQRKLGAVITKDPIACLQTMTVDIRCSKDQPYRIALYLVDWEKEGRRSAIEVFDVDNKQLLMPVKVVTDYENGKYVLLEADRSVRIRIDQVRGTNASLSALFID